MYLLNREREWTTSKTQAAARGKFRQIITRKGGGTRVYKFNRDDPQTIQKIMDYAKTIFPRGRNCMGDLHYMDIHTGCKQSVTGCGSQ